MDKHDVYNLAVAFIVTATLIAVPLAFILAIRLRAALPQHRSSRHQKPHSSGHLDDTTALKCTLTVFLGSGGHTAEMLQLVSGLDAEKYPLRHYVVGWDDESSVDKVYRMEASRDQTCLWPSTSVKKEEHPLEKKAGSDIDSVNGSRGYTIHRVPRSRHVHQSMLTTPFTLLKSLLVAMPLITRLTCTKTSPSKVKKDLLAVNNTLTKSVLLMNGPGTCLALALAVIGARMVGFPDEQTPDLIFVESFARVKTLSLAGKLLYPLCDVFLVQWPGLTARYPKARYLGALV